MGKSIILYDRSRTTTDWDCPRKRYLMYEHEGRGVVPGNTSLELYMGTTLHDGLSAIANQQSNGGKVDIDAIASTAQQQMFQALMAHAAGEPEAEALTFANEQGALVEGLLRGFHKYVWPSLMERYPIIHAVEQEMTYPHDGITFMSRPDLVLGNKDNEIWYLEWKSTSSKRDEWMNSWGSAVQLHSSVKAIEHTLGLKADVIVQGLYKGYESYGKQTSPFCYAYHRQGNPPFSANQLSYTYQSGMRKTPTWELAGGVKGWVAGMPEGVLAEQFPQTPPIFVKDWLVEAFFKQCNVREREIDLANSLLEMAEPDARIDVLNTAFPQHFDRCNPGWGKPCPYRVVCHGTGDLSLSGLEQQGFEPRVPHHELEAGQLGVK